jgi:UDP-glucuronate decarboxylase
MQLHRCISTTRRGTSARFPLYVEVDEICFACPASPMHYQFDLVATTKTSVHGATNMLGLAKRTRARILQASTSEVYGDPIIHPQTGSYWATSMPLARVHAMMKLSAAPKLCSSIIIGSITCRSKTHEFPTLTGRAPNDGRVVSNFIVQALKGDPRTVYGDGMQTRSFCYVDD